MTPARRPKPTRWQVTRALEREVAAVPKNASPSDLGELLARQPRREVAQLFRARTLDEPHRAVLLALSHDRRTLVRRCALDLLCRAGRDPQVAARFRSVAAEDPVPLVRRVAWEQLARDPAPASWLDGVEERDPRLRPSWLRAQAAGRFATREPTLLATCERLLEHPWLDVVKVKVALAVAARLRGGWVPPGQRGLVALASFHPVGAFRRPVPWPEPVAVQVYEALASAIPAERVLAADACRRALGTGFSGEPAPPRSPAFVERLNAVGQQERLPAARWAMREALRHLKVNEPWLHSGYCYVHTRQHFAGAFLAEAPSQGPLDALVRCWDPELRALAAMCAQSKTFFPNGLPALVAFARTDPSRQVRRTVPA